MQCLALACRCARALERRLRCTVDSQDSSGQRNLHARGFVKSDSHVLDKVLDIEARCKIAGNNLGAKFTSAQLDARPMTRIAASTQDLTQRLRRTTSLADSDHAGCHQGLIHQLGVLNH